MPGPDDILQRMLQQNPVVRNNPNNAPILNALEHRDAQSGQQLAQNYINTMLNGINSGICSLGYDVASQINGVNTNIMQNSYNTANAITQAQFAQQQSAAALQAQLADCCCQNREAISGVNYNMATSTNAVTTAISNAARDITENQNTNYRQLHDELVAYRMEDKDNTIAELRSQVNALNLSASQSNQNAYLVAQLKTPAPVPAYTVPNPNGYYGCQQNGYQSCGC